MEFKVKTKDGKEINLDRFQLLDILLGEVLSTQKDEFVALSSGLTQYLQQRHMLSTLTIDQLATTCIGLGNYFNVFLQNNDVTIMKGETEDELVNEDTNESASEASSS